MKYAIFGAGIAVIADALPRGAGEFRPDPYHRVGAVLKIYQSLAGTRRHSVETQQPAFRQTESAHAESRS